jgi:hypothetical protein
MRVLPPDDPQRTALDAQHEAVRAASEVARERAEPYNFIMPGQTTVRGPPMPGGPNIGGA